MKRSSAASHPSVRQFRELTSRFFEETFRRFPIQATQAGRHEFDGDLGHARPEVWQRQGKLIQQTLEAIEALAPQDFAGSDLLDRRAMLANLRQQQLWNNVLLRWRNDPQVHLHATADSIFDLIVRHGDDLSPVAGSVLARLRQVPKWLAEAALCIQKPDPLWQHLAAKAAPAVGQFFESLPEPLAKATGQPVAKLRPIARRAALAVVAYARHVAKVLPAAPGSFAIGEERFTLLMHERLGLRLGPREAVAMARRRAEELAQELRREARQFHSRKSVKQILEAAAERWNPEGGSLLEAYQRTTQRTRERFEKAGWMTFPKGDRLLVRLVPDFMRDLIPTAAYSNPGPLDPDQTGIFWVNDLSLTAKTPRARAAEIAQHFGLELTCAHEAYPGHHLQFITQNRHPSLARKMAAHAVYYEGWTLWCEQMAADLGVPQNPYTRLLQLRDELWRAWRIVIDVGLHTGAMTYDQACRTLMREVGFTRARAQADVNWYTAAPTVPMSYLLGKMELTRLKHKRVDMGAMSLREFNDWVLSFGAIPWSWIEESGL